MKNANPVSSLARASVALLLGSCLLGCGSQQEHPQPLKTVFDHFSVSVGGHRASLQLAVLDAEKEHGLMQRPDLGPDEGMLFLYHSPQRMSYWMHNTPEPLDIAFLDPSGAILEIYPMLPLDERSITSRSSDILYALEMPRGWFKANGVRIGDVIDKGELSGAVRARGFDPTAFGMRSPAQN